MTDTIRTIDRRRRVAALSVADLSRRAGIGYTKLWRCFNDARSLTPAEAQRIEAVLSAAELTAATV